MDAKTWADEVEVQRERKDFFLASHPESPLSFDARDRFRGLVYWPPDPKYRFELELHEYDDKETITVTDTGGHERRFWRWGAFCFEIDGQQCSLQAYKSDSTETRLFVPFRDKTSGKESYGAGRYLDLESETHRTKAGRWIVDFNEAYNPWCAYSINFICPFVPLENWLEVPVYAGEQKYPFGKE